MSNFAMTSASDSIVSDRPSAIASSFSLIALSPRHCEFCSNATNRNVMIVVIVLITSCQVSTVPNNGRLGAQSTTSSTQKTKNHARLTNLDARSANLSKNVIGAL